MASIASVLLELVVEDSTGVALSRKLLPIRFSPIGTDGQVQTLTLTGSAFTAITVPAGATLLMLEIPASAVSLTLKGVTGDTGIALTPASNSVGVPILIPLGASPSIGILNGGSTTTVQAVFL